MGVLHKKFWIKILETDLIEAASISLNTLAKLGKNEYISMEVVERKCKPFSVILEM